MLIGENILLALNGLRANKMRSLLTMLGIIIGIASVIAIMTLVDFFQQFRYRLYGIHGCQQHYRRCISEKYVTGDDIQRNDLFYGPQIHEDDRG